MLRDLCTYLIDAIAFVFDRSGFIHISDLYTCMGDCGTWNSICLFSFGYNFVLCMHAVTQKYIAPVISRKSLVVNKQVDQAQLINTADIGGCVP